MNILISVALLAFAGLFQEGDAAITAWVTPLISGAADGSGILSVAEDQALNTAIVRYDATSTDTVTYSLVDAVSPFAVDSTNGDLTITAALDFETTTSYTLKIKALDDNDTPGSGTATIAVTVTDVNEADPVFATTYSPCIVDGSTQDTTLTTVAATDADTANSITYTITGGNTGTAFKIGSATGVIQVETGITLDKSTTASYDLEVTATDDGSGANSASTTVSITVADSCASGSVAVAVSIVTVFVALCATLI